MSDANEGVTRRTFLSRATAAAAVAGAPLQMLAQERTRSAAGNSHSGASAGHRKIRRECRHSSDHRRAHPSF